MSKFVGSQVNEHEHKIFICDCCLNYFGQQKLLNEHLEYRNKHDVVNSTYPKPGENILKFKNSI